MALAMLLMIVVQGLCALMAYAQNRKNVSFLVNAIAMPTAVLATSAMACHVDRAQEISGYVAMLSGRSRRVVTCPAQLQQSFLVYIVRCKIVKQIVKDSDLNSKFKSPTRIYLILKPKQA
jgi:hypothetical protein